MADGLTKANALQILDLDLIPIQKRFWVVLRKELIDARTLRLFAADCAERVLHLLERECPEDRRPQIATEAARLFRQGEELRAARAAAETAFAVAHGADAAQSAALASAQSAAYAAREAATLASRLARYAGVAAKAAEREWQLQRLREYLRAER